MEVIGGFLVLIGFFAFVVGVPWLVIAAFRKMDAKIPAIVTSVALVAFIAGGTLLPSEATNEDSTSPAADATAAALRANPPTRIPSATRTPVPAVKECPTTAEIIYLAELGEGFEVLGDAFGRWSTEVEKAERNPILIVDDNWRLTVTVIAALIIAQGDQLLDLNRPASTDFLYDDLAEMFGLQQQSLELFVASLDNFDVVDIERAGRDLAVANAMGRDLAATLEAFCEHRP